jgi:hypothetical protein
VVLVVTIALVMMKKQFLLQIKFFPLSSLPTSSTLDLLELARVMDLPLVDSRSRRREALLRTAFPALLRSWLPICPTS